MAYKTLVHRDLDQRTLTVERRFAAPLERVWQAYTDPAILDRWWGPQPWHAETVRMDFREGGHWFYVMKGPEGERHYCRMDFLTIELHRRFVVNDVFTDEAGETNADMPVQNVATTFTDEGETTLVVAVANYPTLEDLQTVLEMGMEAGITQAQDQLAALLTAGG